jgi:hypothetical protein
LSRSKHTRPEQILAADRLRAPREPRGKNDPSAFHQIARALKEAGVVLESQNDGITTAPALPRVITKRPRSGFIHPASKSDIIAILQFFGERCFYGLRSIKLVQRNESTIEADLVLGRLEVPGTILIYEQAEPPWFLNGSLTESEKAKLIRAGALVETAADNVHSLVHWKSEDLKNFMLFEVLLHEIGHHLIQQYKGKRSVRIARTKDHEKFAELFAQKCREYHRNQHTDVLNA